MNTFRMISRVLVVVAVVCAVDMSASGSRRDTLNNKIYNHQGRFVFAVANKMIPKDQHGVKAVMDTIGYSVDNNAMFKILEPSAKPSCDPVDKVIFLTMDYTVRANMDSILEAADKVAPSLLPYVKGAIETFGPEVVASVVVAASNAAYTKMAGE